MGSDWQCGTTRGSSDRAPLAAGPRRGFELRSQPGFLVGNSTRLREPHGALESSATADRSPYMHPPVLKTDVISLPLGFNGPHLTEGKKTGMNPSQIPSR